MTMDAHFWIALWEIIIVNILLSGDNAVVIALASRNLPDGQRRMAILLGSAGAILLRVIFTGVIGSLMQLPYLKIVGGALLLWIGVKLMVPEHDEKESKIQGAAQLWAAVRIIVIADAVMSLDNVIAIAGAAKGDMTLIVIGLLISIPLIIFGSQLVLQVLLRYPILVTGGAALLGWIAGEVIVTDPAIEHWVEANAGYLHHYRVAPAIGAAIVVALGMLLVRQQAAKEIATREPVVDLAKQKE
jgi:YjbE family integral membrane protein